MRPVSSTGFLMAISMGVCLFAGSDPVMAQDDLGGQSLGGFGANPMRAMSRAGAGPMIPYAGGFGGFMPYRMAGAGSLAFRPPAMRDSVRSSFSLSTMAGGMGTGGRSSLTSRPQGGMGPRLRPMATRPGGMGVMPPRFGYPFRQPPSPESTPGGMSMSMP